MPVWSIVLLVIIAILVVALIALIIVGNKLRKKQTENQAQIDAAKQIMSMLIIDKKKMKLKEAGLPKIVLEQTPKYLQRSKVPVVKAKIGPKAVASYKDGTLSVPSLTGRDDVISSMCVAAVFIIIMLSLSSYIFQKRDI